MTLSRQPIVRIALCLVMGLTLANCGGVPYYDQVYYEYGEPKGVYHPVEKGQTLYSIARAYGLSVEELQKINGITDPSDMDIGHHLWIPDRDRVVYVAPTVETGPDASESVSPEETIVPPKKPVPKRKETASTRKRQLMWPVRGGVLTSHFGTRGGKNHHGIDIGASRGTPIRAAGPGTVKFSGWGPTGYGLMVIIKHPGNLTTVYAHNSRNLVKKGSKVKRGQMIARVGKTGRASGPHVHFEVRNDTHPKNPLLYLSKK
ncbi:MAG: M23 family metallopeptidase [Nitrospinota bacterium]|nr:M23 family metallopeptidase [Nitrospinota bacterium]